jgi:Fe2+ or Zn2+ uptake regulation protein
VRDVRLAARVERTLDRTFDELATAEGFTVGRHAIDVFGICADCAA